MCYLILELLPVAMYVSYPDIAMSENPCIAQKLILIVGKEVQFQPLEVE